MSETMPSHTKLSRPALIPTIRPGAYQGQHRRTALSMSQYAIAPLTALMLVIHVGHLLTALTGGVRLRRQQICEVRDVALIGNSLSDRCLRAVDGVSGELLGCVDSVGHGLQRLRHLRNLRRLSDCRSGRLRGRGLFRRCLLRCTFEDRSVEVRVLVNRVVARQSAGPITDQTAVPVSLTAVVLAGVHRVGSQILDRLGTTGDDGDAGGSASGGTCTGTDNSASAGPGDTATQCRCGLAGQRDRTERGGSGDGHRDRTSGETSCGTASSPTNHPETGTDQATTDSADRAGGRGQIKSVLGRLVTVLVVLADPAGDVLRGDVTTSGLRAEVQAVADRPVDVDVLRFGDHDRFTLDVHHLGFGVLQGLCRLGDTGNHLTDSGRNRLRLRGRGVGNLLRRWDCGVRGTRLGITRDLSGVRGTRLSRVGDREPRTANSQCCSSSHGDSRRQKAS